MKTATRLIIILFMSGLTSNFATAQQESNALISETNAPTLSPATEAAGKTAIPVNEKATTMSLLSMNEKNGIAKLNYSLPAFTYSATLLIQDFTGRTLKTFNLNPHNKSAMEFSLNDLLSGTYCYVLILDNQKKMNGEFVIKD